MTRSFRIDSQHRTTADSTPTVSTLSPFRYFTTSPQIIHRAVMMYIRFPLSLRNVENLLHAASTSAMKPFAPSGAVSVRYSLPKSAGGASTG